MTNAAEQLRELLRQPGLVDAVGAHDVISAQMVDKAGFPVVYVGGAATAASNFGLPDIGLVSPLEFVEQARRVTSVVRKPVIVDLDDGGGNPLRVRYAVMLLEQAGVAGFHIEDTDITNGKHFLGSGGAQADLDVSRDRMRPPEEFATFIRAAAEARSDANTVVIARTDAPVLTSLDDGIARAKVYAEAGADMILMRGVTPDEVADVVRALPVPLAYMALLDVPAADIATVEAAGAKLLVRPNLTRVVAFRAVADMLAELRSTNEVTTVRRPTYGETGGAVDSPRWGSYAERYGM